MMASSSPRSVEPAFRDAVTDCVARLELCDRNLITFHYVHGVGVDQLCEMFSIPRTGMVRQLARIRERVLRDLRSALAARLPLDRDELRAEIDRLLELARRRFDHVVARVLRA
jgi:DNA-directed RNA polymerase specialized sigma24 family protein